MRVRRCGWPVIADFASKDDLVATVVADQSRARGERLRVLPPGESGLEQFVRDYPFRPSVALTDRRRADEVLEQGVRNGLAVLGAAHHSC
ncbi:hypothetical protein MycrhDRAFT_3415 [Mycolicibacterium rhodesiae JS60]|nr:hypothetical protein MycrhDRAFT_3415 [Mycolicibacterium rhodesiae JS60]